MALIGALLLAQSKKSVLRVPKLLPPPLGNFLKCAPGYQVSLFAEGLRNPRMMAVAPNGNVFVVETRIERAEKNQPNRVVVLYKDHQGKMTSSVWADNLNLPFGIQFGFGHLYVANTDSIVRWSYGPGQTAASGPPETVLTGIPERGYRNHWTRNIRFAPDGHHLFLSIGSEENLAEEGPRRAVVERYVLDSHGAIVGKGETWSSGMRNPIGMDFEPSTRALWVNVAERDYQGDDQVPDFLTHASQGDFYGWPYFAIGPHRDRRMPNRPDLRSKVRVPDVVFPAHSTPIDIKFWRGGAAVAFHGSQNRSRMNGYKVMWIPFSGGKPSGKPVDLVTGFLKSQKGREIYGRPAGLAVLPDGSLLVTDDWNGRIYRVSPTS